MVARYSVRKAPHFRLRVTPEPITPERGREFRQSLRQYVKQNKASPPSPSARRMDIAVQHPIMKRMMERTSRRRGNHLHSHGNTRYDFGAWEKDNRKEFLFHMMDLRYNPKKKEMKTNPYAIPALETGLRDESAGVKCIALTGLAFARSRRSVPIIVPRLSDKEFRVRNSAKSAISYIGVRSPKVIDELEYRLKRESVEHMQPHACHGVDELYHTISVLLSLRSKKSFPAIREAMDWWRRNFTDNPFPQLTRYEKIMRTIEKGEPTPRFLRVAHKSEIDNLMNSRHW